ncbi:hypothetical protein VOLCADRAFT_102817 [Volvox carteri f. nagariensis]|uniref:Uncharacterized protein n=1 Tax=Volvox carteri f. nagariensis TaxID=3068 RepID=D8TIB8_VOLCA|nr:uncharacterized protein VOLCADRAFT_102817 [Volvox carteri f. nagariensis]EFJ52863.1 hypothetical protein VOLCADRAFT_102817 [Volvox carteri f. nagariensis]|eukprot:XP_002945868.1 hypothetical protein VOLCADRAFT_102817 [Volvox carteri f. nagariensis]
MAWVTASSQRFVAPTQGGHRHTPIVPYIKPAAVWTRPTPDRDADFVKPSYIPQPVQPSVTPSREDRPIYAPITPEFRPAELPETPKELPSAPKLPERRPDDIPAGNPKEKPSEGAPEKREAPPSKDRESAPKK